MLRLLVLVFLGFVGSVGLANAEIIVFANGRSMSVKDVRIDGERMTVTLRGGGEATFDKAIVARIAPDEVPDVQPAERAAGEAASAVGAALEALGSRPFATLIESVAVQHGVPPALVHAMVQAESNYRPRARSDAGARGLMQVMPGTGAQFGVGNLYDPQNNLQAGVQYLKQLLTRFDLTQAIAAYNAGPAAVSKYQGVPPFPETQQYVRKVLSNFPR